MICNKCNFESSTDSRFCEKCGNQLIVECENCGKNFPIGTPFCDNCGKRLYSTPNNRGFNNQNNTPPQRRKISIVAIISMTFGIIALFSCILSFFYPIIFAIPAIIAGGVGLKPNRNLKGLAIGGLLIGIISIVICLIAMIGFRTMSLMY